MAHASAYEPKSQFGRWLDARLPEVVDRLVAQEIARITARGL